MHPVESYRITESVLLHFGSKWLFLAIVQAILRARLKSVLLYYRELIIKFMNVAKKGLIVPWNPPNRVKYDHKTDRYPSDLTDREWEIIKPLIPQTRRGDRPRTTDMREVINAIYYMAYTGCQWRTLPSDFSSWQCGKACKDDPLGGKSASSLTHLVWLQKLLFVVQRWKGKRG